MIRCSSQEKVFVKNGRVTMLTKVVNDKQSVAHGGGKNTQDIEKAWKAYAHSLELSEDR